MPCASSAGSFLGEAPSLVSKAEVSGPEAGRPKGTSSWAIVPQGGNSSFWTRRSQGCLEEELLLPRLPHLLSISLLGRQVSARPLYLVALWKSGGTMPHGAGDGHLCLLLSARCHVLSLRGSKKQKTRTGRHPVSFSLVRLLAEQLLGPS